LLNIYWYNLHSLDKFYLKLWLSLMGIIYPLIMWFWVGPLESISAYFLTPAQFLFLLFNAGTSFYFVSTKNWLVPGVLLLLLSCFSIQFFQNIHNVFAISFFIASLVSIFRSKRYKWLGFGVISGLFGLFNSIFLAEYIAIVFISIFHILILKDFYIIKKKRHKILV